MTSFSKLLQPSTKKVAVGGVVLAALYYKLYVQPKQPRKTSASTVVPSASSAKKEKIAVDAVFFKRLWRLLKIIVPGVMTPEMGFMMLVSLSLVSRTMADLWIIATSTSIERAIIGRKRGDFIYHLFQFFLGMVPVALVNSLLRYSLSELALRFRTRLTKYLYALYMKGFVYYRLGNLDNRIPNADQLLTTDVEKFCGSIAELFSNISKPTLDIVIFSRKLSGALGVEGPMMMLGYLVMSGLVLTHLRRPLGRYTVEEQRLEGEFRAVNSRVITHSEEIAFYGGNTREQETINGAFNRLVKHLRHSHQFRFVMGITDSIITKYFATVVGFLIMSRGFINAQASGKPQAQIMEEYYRNGRMLMSLAGAVGRLVLAGRELTRLAGFTARVTELITVLKELDAGSYKRSMVAEQSIAHPVASVNPSELPANFGPNQGKIIYQDRVIEFDHVPLVTPNGDVLIPSLTFKVVSGQNVLVAGPNGCGKSSLFRILGGLWPVFGGILVKPTTDKLFYVPQRPYMTLGTLRDQVLYPLSYKQSKEMGITDAQLYDALKLVQLDHLVDREGGWDTIQDWMDKLSGGEKQRLAMARLFVHRPQFAILDECTSAVSVDVEGMMYTHCKEIGITLFTVSHRKSLWKYHEAVLQFDGRGSYEFKPIDQESTTQFGS
jgi:ATP-binding cassette subfamily D (ALD) protein 3